MKLRNEVFSYKLFPFAPSTTANGLICFFGIVKVMLPITAKCVQHQEEITQNFSSQFQNNIQQRSNEKRQTHQRKVVVQMRHYVSLLIRKECKVTILSGWKGKFRITSQEQTILYVTFCLQFGYFFVQRINGFFQDPLFRFHLLHVCFECFHLSFILKLREKKQASQVPCLLWIVVKPKIITT